MSTMPCGHPIECVSGGMTQHCRWCYEVASLRYQESESTARYLREKEKVAELREHLQWATGIIQPTFRKDFGREIECLFCGANHPSTSATIPFAHCADCRYETAVRAAEGK